VQLRAEQRAQQSARLAQGGSKRLGIGFSTSPIAATNALRSAAFKASIVITRERLG